MSQHRMDDEVPQLRRLQEWWLRLPLSYRVNALLYLLAAGALVLLVSFVLSGNDRPRPVQVGAGVPPTTTTTRAGGATRPPSTVSGASAAATTTTVGGATTTTRGGSGGGASNTTTTRARGGTGASGGGASGGGGTGGGGTGGGGQSSPAPPPSGGGDQPGTTAPATPSDTTPPATTPPDTTAPPTTTTTAPPPDPCRDSGDPGCGPFRWDPAPEPNQSLTVTVVPRPTNPRAGETVFFDVTVEDPDHLVDANCAEVRFGDGTTQNSPCTTPPCPPHHGPWSPPARQAGHFTITFSHTYKHAATFPAKFTFRSFSTDRCLGLDPYASEGSVTINVQVAP